MLDSKFGTSTRIENKNKLFNVYQWEKIEEGIGTKFKNEIDKHLNTIPISTDTDFDLKSKPAQIIDTYKWETPKIYIELKHSFGGEDGEEIRSIITLTVNNK